MFLSGFCSVLGLVCGLSVYYTLKDIAAGAAAGAGPAQHCAPMLGVCVGEGGGGGGGENERGEREGGRGGGKKRESANESPCVCVCARANALVSVRLCLHVRD